MTPEQKARIKIDRMLEQSGWLVQDLKGLNLGTNLGIAVREFPTETGPADYMLFVDSEPLEVIEAKPEGTILTMVEEQSGRYATSKLKWSVKKEKLPFI
jgi:type I restriction enzyme R subunit